MITKSRTGLKAMLFCCLSASLLGRADTRLKEIDAYIQKAMKEWESPGLAVGIVRGDSILMAKGYGVRQMGKPEKVDEHTIFPVGSQTKPFTTAALAMLVDEGKLKWDDPVIRYLPDFKLGDPYVTQNLTIRDCLTHRIGFENLDLLWIITEFGREELLSRYRYAKPVAGFRSAFDYNNMMFILAGQLIPAVTGMSWDDFIQQRILDPLGMRSSGTRFAALSEKSNVAIPQEKMDGRIQTIPWFDADNVGPAGSIHSNVVDMIRWLRFQLRDGEFEGNRLIQAGSMKEMHSPQMVASLAKWSAMPHVPFHAISVPQSDFMTYGLGWFVQEYRGHSLLHHAGDLDGFRCMVGMIPDLDLGIVLFSNLHPATLVDALLFRIADVFIGTADKDWSAEFLSSVREYEAKAAEIQKKRAATPAGASIPVSLDKYVGTFENEIFGEAEVIQQDGKLMLHLGRILSVLRPIQGEMFLIMQPLIYAGRLPVIFKRNENGSVGGFRFLGVGEFCRKMEE